MSSHECDKIKNKKNECDINTMY